MPDAPTITAVLCTLDRGPDIVETVASLLDQDLPRDRFEVLLVDNGSREENAAVLRRLADEHAPTLRYVREEQRGLSHARNRGIREARGELLAFADDDARVTPRWLSTFVEAFAQNPRTGVLGSAVELVFAAERPAWLEDWLLPYLGAFDRGQEYRALTALDGPRGGNMAFRRSVFRRIGGFSPAFGRRPGSLISLEEIEICARAEAAGFELGYVPGAPLRHLVEAYRFENGWFEQRLHWQGRSLALFDRVRGGRRRLLLRLPGQVRRWLVRSGLRSRVPGGYVLGACRLLLGLDRAPDPSGPPVS
jgi:glucosyl-dolichyl phosphate glucuronosyltransferase